MGAQVSRVGDWLEERVGYRAILKSALEEPVPGGARWAYVFGSVLMFLLVLQAVTGVLLAAHYGSSATQAWASVAYLQTQVPLGWLIRGIHSAGASAMMIVVDLHLLQVTLFGAYRKPREVNWWVGLAMMACLFGFALTGYLLPWDQKGYWATQVATSLLGAMPVVGNSLKSLLLGGSDYGNYTITHFYALHILVLPAAMATLAVVHLALFRKHGVTSWARKKKESGAPESSAPFWPDQLVRDFAAMLLVLGLMLAFVLRSHGASLEAPADPTSAYDARPEWYFLPLYQMLKYFPGRLEIVAALGVPLLIGGALAALPLLDAAEHADASKRKRFVAVVILFLGGGLGLGLQAHFSDSHNAAFQRSAARAEREGARALKLAEAGVPPAGGLAVLDNDPLSRAQKIFHERCIGCHLLGGEGERRAPDLDGWSSRAWLSAFLRDPSNERFYGKTKIHGMKPVKPGTIDGADFDALVEWIFSQGGGDGVDAKKAARGREVFESSGCDECHESDGKTAGEGIPNLGGRASAAWLAGFIADPSGETYFGSKNDMPKFGAKCSAAEIDALVALVRNERNPPQR